MSELYAGTLPAQVPGRHSFAAEMGYVFYMVVFTTAVALCALIDAALHGIDLFYVLLAFAIQIPITFGITAGLHRLFSHKSFKCKRWLELTLASLGAMGGEDFFVRWVYVHRLHHRHTDQPGDPHSPWFDGDRPLNAWRGLLHAHNGWLFRAEPAVTPDLVPDILRDRGLMLIDRASPLLTLLGLLIPGLLALLYEATWASFWLGVLWGGCVRSFVIIQLSWSVNSFGHRFGALLPGQKHQARNNPALGAITMGDGWHANHHQYASSARHGFGSQLDLTWLVLVGMSKLGWVWDMKLPPEASMQSTLIPATQGEGYSETAG